MDNFKLDLEYKRSDEYNSWISALRKDFPEVPEHLLDYAIICHKMHPQAYKNAYKEGKNRGLRPPTTPSNMGEKPHEDKFNVVGVSVLNEDEVGELKYAKIVEK